MSRALWRVGVSRWFVTELPHGTRVRFYPSSVSAALWANPRACSEDEDFVWAVLREGDRYIDAGANIGQLAVAAARRVGARGEVSAFEAHPRTFEFLKGNVELNDASVVRATHCALGDEEGELYFTSQRSDDQNYVSREAGAIRVPVRRLDDLVAPGTTRLLKLDVEGFELPVLRGASKTIAHTEVVYCELSEGNCARFGYHPEEVERLLLQAGFVFLRVSGDGLPHTTDQPYFGTLDRAMLPATGYNLIAARPHVVEDIARRLNDAGWRRPVP